MPLANDIGWLKDQFQPEIESAIAGSPLTVDFLVALACQETGEVWPLLRRAGLPASEILALCVGDTLDSDKGRGAFPRTKDELVAAPQGAAMFAIARQALIDMSAHVKAYQPAAARPNKFCHGFGMFQRDLQFFKTDPAYFLDKDYAKFSSTLGQAILELKGAIVRLGFGTRSSLTDLELCAVGIAYNTGGYKPAKGLRQGYFDGSKYYGETLFDYVRLAHTVPGPGAPASLATPSPGHAALTQVAAVTSAGTLMAVQAPAAMLRVRSEPAVSESPQGNVVSHLPDGHAVQVLAKVAKGGFLPIETSLHGALVQGFVAKKFLQPAPPGAAIALTSPAAADPTTGITAVYAPSRPGVMTRRTGDANALSLNEPNQPARTGASAEELRGELANIVAWLDCEDESHARYWPRDGLTFCNVYAHDFCRLAGVYLPRVWWTSKALVALAGGDKVEPKLGATISEVVANELFAWLRDFGPTFGWRASGSLTELQTEVNQGGVGVIVARRKESGRPGHICMVVPETAQWSARRDSSGLTIAPLQSQAGATNFRYGTGKKDWWLGDQFAEFAFWLHA